MHVAQVLNWPAALARMAVVCCLCHVDLSSGVASKKRKKLYGNSAQHTRFLLEEVAVTKFQVTKPYTDS